MKGHIAQLLPVEHEAILRFFQPEVRVALRQFEPPPKLIELLVLPFASNPVEALGKLRKTFNDAEVEALSTGSSIISDSQRQFMFKVAGIEPAENIPDWLDAVVLGVKTTAGRYRSKRLKELRERNETDTPGDTGDSLPPQPADTLRRPRMGDDLKQAVKKAKAEAVQRAKPRLSAARLVAAYKVLVRESDLSNPELSETPVRHISYGKRNPLIGKGQDFFPNFLNYDNAGEGTDKKPRPMNDRDGVLISEFHTRERREVFKRAMQVAQHDELGRVGG